MSGQPPKQDGETRTYWRTAGTATVVVAVLSLIGVIVQARGDSSGPTAAPATTAGPVTTAGSSETIDSTTRPTEPRQGVLKLRVGEVAAGKWYPAAGQLPKDAPPDYDLGDWYFHCDKWAKWLIKRGAAPLGSDVVVGVTAPDSAPLTITQVEVQVFSKKRLQGDLIQCGYEAGGELGSAIFPNLDSPSGPISMDADGDGDRDGSLPGGRFVVKPGEFEWLTILADGTAGQVYELGFVFHMVVEGEQRTEVHGTSELPIRLAFYDDTSQQMPAFDWDPHFSRWIPSDEYMRERQAGG